MQIVTSRSKEDINAWTNHISGATALLDLRGAEQLRSEAGLRLFLHLRYQIVSLHALDSLYFPLKPDLSFRLLAASNVTKEYQTHY